MALVFLNGAGGTGEIYTDATDLLTKIQATLLAAGWTASMVGSTIVADPAGYTSSEFALEFATDATNLTIRARVNRSSFDVSDPSYIQALGTKLWMIADDKTAIVWLNATQPAVYAGEFIASGADFRPFAIGYIAANPASEALKVASSSPTDSTWLTGYETNRADANFSGGASKSVGFVCFKYPVLTAIDTYRGNLKYLVRGVSGASVGSILLIPTGAQAGNYVVTGPTSAGIGMRMS